MSNEVIDALRSLIPAKHKISGRGWICFNCPSCGDKRGRFGLLFTSTLGFRISCKNGGCRWETPTGWEPDNGFMGRPRRLFEIMGGDINDIPQSLIDGPHGRIVKKFNLADKEDCAAWVALMQSEWSPEAAATKIRTMPDQSIAIEFPTISLPTNSKFLWECNTPDALDAQNYVLKRGKFFKDSRYINRYSPLVWSPRYKRYVIIPFIDNKKIIGWIARKIDSGKEFAHIKCLNFPTDYMLNQNLRFRYPDVLVVEGAFDAIALRALCTFGNTISKKQANLLDQLKSSGKRIVLIPDFKKDEWRSYLSMARQHNWSVCVPEWPGDDNYSSVDHIKDPGDSIKRNGLVYTIETVMSAITDDYDYAEQILVQRSR